LRRYLLAFGLLAIVFLVMPTAMARFSGQHTFVNGSGVDCTKCHPDIGSEIGNSHAHNWTSADNAVDSDSEGCKACHIPKQGNTNMTGESYLNKYGTGQTSTYHAAALIECTFCHGQNNASNTTLGDNIPGANVSAEFTSTEAHLPLFNRSTPRSSETDWLKSSNEACVACHTATANVTVTGEYSNLSITANMSNNCGSGDANCYKAAGTSAWWNISMEAVR